MNLKRSYKCLTNQSFSINDYTLIPIRDEDKYDILKWRNEQIDILRQSNPLTEEQQNLYFKTVVSQLFEQEQPTQILWSLLLKGKLIGYGGLVHIDWENKTAEISFLTETQRNKDVNIFIEDWVNYLSLIKQLADIYLNFNSIFTYAYDIRPNLYVALEKSGFKETKRIKDFIEINNELKDVVIHTFYFNKINMRLANEKDVDTYFNWANDELVREFSYQKDMIKYEYHVSWFNSKIKDANFKFYIFENESQEPIGQIRINKNDTEVIIGISIDKKYRGEKFGLKMLYQATSDYFKLFPDIEINAYIKQTNEASINLFTKAGFNKIESLELNGCMSYKFKKTSK